MSLIESELVSGGQEILIHKWVAKIDILDMFKDKGVIHNSIQARVKREYRFN